MKTAERPNRPAIVLATLAGVVLAVGVLMLWHTVEKRAHEHAGSSTRHTINMNELLIQQDFDNRRLALDRLASRTVIAGAPTKASWMADASRYLRDMPGFVAIEWIDAGLETRWRVVADGDPGPADTSAAIVDVRSAIARTQPTRSQVVSDVFTVAGGDVRLAVIVPVLNRSAVDGVIVGVLDPGRWMDAVIGRLQGPDHHVEVQLAGHTVYRHRIPGDVPDVARIVAYDFWTGDLNWTLRVTPTTSFLSAGHADSSTLVLLAGMLLSAVTTLAVYLARHARDRSHQLHDVASRLSTLFKNLPGMAYRRNDSTDVPLAFVSEGCRNLSGYTRQEFARGQRDWLDLIHPDDRERVATTMRDALQSGNAFETEYRITHKNGGTKWMWDRGQAVPSEVDQKVHLEGFVSDMTVRKEAEHALIEARAFSDAVIDTAADAVITIDEHGAIGTFNRAAQRMFGYAENEAIGMNIEQLMPESYRSEHGNFVRRYAASTDAGTRASKREVKALRKDGSVFPIHLSISAVSTGRDRKIVGLIHDVSEQRAAESEAREHREHLAHVDRLNMLGEMATGIAHEINQPLSAISILVQAGDHLIRTGRYAKLSEILEKLVRHAHRASAVIDRMQQMAKRHVSTKETLDCTELIGDVTRLAEAEARIRDIEIKTEIQDDLPTVSADAVQIQQVALNLLRNGMDAMQSISCRNGNTVGLRARLRDDGNVEIAVIDNGTGVPEDAAENIFAPFSTTKKSGMGMGLSISRAIVTAHGGNLDFHNNQGAGATFFFTLPPVEQEDAP